MADLSITAANVKWVRGVSPAKVRAGAASVRGKAVYLDSADNEHKLADAATSAATAAAVGVSLSDMVDGADMVLAKKGAVINIGATTTAGVPYVVSSTGGIAPYADLTTDDIPCILFWGSGTAEVTLICEVSPAALG